MDTFDCILAIAEHRNITRAAEAVFMTQPALTLRLNRYEEELGVKLFDRSRTPVRITKQGEYYIQEMKKIRISEEKMRRHLHELSSITEKTITLGIGFNRGNSWLPSLLPSLISEFPDINFQIKEASDRELEQLVKQGEIDIGIIGSPVVDSEVATHRIGQEKLFLAVPPDNPIFHNVPDVASYTIENPYVIKDYALLKDQTFIIGSNSYGISRIMNVIFDNYRIRPKRTINIGNTGTSYQLAALGLGISIMLKPTAKIVLNNENMKRPVPCTLDGFPMNRTVSLMMKSSYKETLDDDRLLKSLEEKILNLIG